MMGDDGCEKECLFLVVWMFSVKHKVNQNISTNNLFFFSFLFFLLTCLSSARKSRPIFRKNLVFSLSHFRFSNF